MVPYKFGGEILPPKNGGTDRCEASQLTMEDWGEEYKNILENSEIEIFILAGYVDGGRQLTFKFGIGIRYDMESRSFKY